MSFIAEPSTIIFRASGLAQGRLAQLPLIPKRYLSSQEYRQACIAEAAEYINVQRAYLSADEANRVLKATAGVLVIAGLGSRWKNSIFNILPVLHEMRERHISSGPFGYLFNSSLPSYIESDMNGITHDGIDKLPEISRSLFPVPDIRNKGVAMPMFMYNMLALAEFGEHYLVVGESPYFEGIEGLVREHTGISNLKIAVQHIPFGNADAVKPAFDILSEQVEYAVVNFTSDINSPAAATNSVILTAALDKAVKETGSSYPVSVMPTSIVYRPPYPIQRNDDGQISYFVQPRLQGKKAAVKPGETNIGVRAYTRDALTLAFSHFVFESGTGYSVPGHSEKEQHTLALDDVDQFLLNSGLFVTLPYSTYLESYYTMKEMRPELFLNYLRSLAKVL